MNDFFEPLPTTVGLNLFTFLQIGDAWYLLFEDRTWVMYHPLSTVPMGRRADVWEDAI